MSARSLRSTRLHTLRNAIDQLEGRNLFAAGPRELLAIAAGFTGSTTDSLPGAIAIYDVTDIKTAGNDPFASPTAGATPLFSMWPGYEITRNSLTGNNRDLEESTAFAVSPNGRTGYMLAFDSGTANGLNASGSGDSLFDYDLYKFDIAKAYDDFITNSRPRGIQYAPAKSFDYNPTGTTNTGIDYLTEYSTAAVGVGPTGLPAVTSANDGVPRAQGNAALLIRDNTDTIGSNDIIFMDGLIAKVGEVARVNSAANNFFNQQDIQVVDDNTILLMENSLILPTLTGSIGQDYSIRTLERKSTSPGLAVNNGDGTGGNNGLNVSESWESHAWTGDNFVNMDNIPANGTGGISDVDGMRYVNRDGQRGVWVSDRDGSGDELDFFALNFATRTAKKQAIIPAKATEPNTYRLDEDPNANLDDGELDGFDLDSNGNLVMRESGFFDTPKTEPKVVRQAIANYLAGGSITADGSGSITLGAGTVSPNIVVSGAIDDDTAVTNGLYSTFDAAQNILYFIDIDSVGADGVVAADVNPDVYAYDLTTNTLVYSKLNIANAFLGDGNKIRAFTMQPLDTVAPTVASTAFNYAGTRQSVSVTFSEDVGASLAAGDFILTNVTTGAVVPAADIALSYSAASFTATLLFSGVPGASSPTALASGRYTISFAANTVADAANNALAAGTKGTFAFKDGDLDGSLTTDFADLLTLAKNYGKTTGATFSGGDTDYNGTVDFSDLLILAKNYGQSLPPAPAAASNVVTARKSTRATATVTI